VSRWWDSNCQVLNFHLKAMLNGVEQFPQEQGSSVSGSNGSAANLCQKALTLNAEETLETGGKPRGLPVPVISKRLLSDQTFVQSSSKTQTVEGMRGVMVTGSSRDNSSKWRTLGLPLVSSQTVVLLVPKSIAQ